MSTGVLIAVLTTVLAGVGGAQAHAAEKDQSHGVREWPVSFEIVNKNDSAAERLCTGDGETYTLRGSLVGPPGVRAGDAVTLYVPGSGDASTWHFTFTDVPGVDYVTEMARVGHASVFLHPLGFGPSDPVDGNAVCFGTYADHVAQVIDQLRHGSYSINGRSAPEYARVALAGHSAGGFIAELTQVSFAAADALIVAGWTGYALGVGVADDLDPLLPFPYGTAVAKTERCATAPESKWGEDGPGGWAYMFTEPAEWDMLVHNIHPDVLKAFVPQYEQDPCGWGLEGEVSNLALASRVQVPVLVGSGEHDPIAPPAAVELQHARYALGNDDVTSFTILGAGHQIMHEDSDLYPQGWGREFRGIMSNWLKDRGF